jgi:hypothetical protein
VWQSHLGRLEVDEAVMGLAARGILHGHITAFWPGQNYGGTIEPILTAPLVAAFGMTVFAVRAVPVTLAAVASVLTWRLGRYTIGEPAARVAGALFWVAPAYWIWMSERARGFYEASLVLELLVLIFVVRLRRRPSWQEAALLGLLTGLAWWQTPAVFVAIIPALAWLVYRQRAALRYAPLAAATAVVGAAPWFLSNLHHHWWSLSASSGDTPYALRLRGFVSSTLPMSLNVRVPFTSEWLAGKALSGLLYIALIALFAVVAWRRRHTDASLLPVILIAFGPLAAISPFAWRITEPRYEIPLMPILALLLAAAVGTTTRAAALLLLAATVTSLVCLTRFGVEEQRDDGADVIGPLITELDRRHVTSLCATPTIAFRVDFATNSRITAAECEPHELRRRGHVVFPAYADRTSYPDLVRQVAAQRYPAWVFIKRTPDESRARPLLAAAGYRRSTNGLFAVYAR